MRQRFLNALPWMILAALAGYGYAGHDGPQASIPNAISQGDGDTRYVNVTGETQPIKTTSASAAALEASAGGVTFAGNLTDTGASGDWTVSDGSGWRLSGSGVVQVLGSSGGLVTASPVSDSVGWALYGKRTTGTAPAITLDNAPSIGAQGNSAAAGVQQGTKISATLNQTGTAGYDLVPQVLTETTIGSGEVNFLKGTVGATVQYAMSHGGMLSTTPQIATLGSGAVSLSPTSSVVYFSCSGACTVTLTETGLGVAYRDGACFRAIHSAAQVATLADTAGVMETSGGALDQYDSTEFCYLTDRWVQSAALQNN